MSGSSSYNASVRLGVEGGDAAEREFRRMEASAASLERRLGAGAAVQRQYERDSELLQKALAAGAISAERAAQAQDLLDQRFVKSMASASGLAEAQARQAKASEEAARAAERQAAEIDQLRAKFIPLYQASRQYEVTLEEIARAEQLGAINARQASAAREQAAKTLGEFGTAASAAGTRTQQLGMHVQNASYQVGDFAVQVASGQSAVTALAQQLPQALGSFGMIGAVAGAGVALAAVGLRMAEVKSESEKLQEALEYQQTAFDEASSRASAYVSTLERQGLQYLSSAEAGRRYRDGLRDEAESVVNLTRYYAGLTDAKRDVAQRQIERSTNDLAARRGGLMSETRSLVGNLLADADRNPAAIAAPLGAQSDDMFALGGPNIDWGKMHEATQALRDFANAGVLSSDAVALLAEKTLAAVRSGDLSTVSYDGMQKKLLELVERIRQWE